MHRLLAAGRATALALILASTLLADTQGRGEGGIVTADTPIYSSSDGDRIVASGQRGNILGAMSSALARDFVFAEKNGRVQVTFLPNGKPGIPRDGWIDPGFLAKFSYDCSCSADRGCSPTRTVGLRGKITMTSEWNTCFQEASAAQLAKLEATNWGQAAQTAMVQTQTVELGQTVGEVEAILGSPQRILKAGTKVIYVYADFKVTFENGKVVDLQ